MGCPSPGPLSEHGDAEGRIAGGACGPSKGEAVGLIDGIHFGLVIGGEGVRVLSAEGAAAALVPLATLSSDAAGRCLTLPLLGQSSVQCPHSQQL